MMTEKELIEKRMNELKTKLSLEENRDVATGIAETGKWNVHKVYLTDRRPRYYISKLSKEKTFEISKRLIYTKFGIEEGLATPVTNRFVNVIYDYETKQLCGLYLVVACPAYVRSNISVKKMTDAITNEDVELIADTHEFNVALRLIDILERERAGRAEAEKQVKVWKEEVSKVGASFGSDSLELWLEGDMATAERMMQKEEGWNFENLKKWIAENTLMFAIAMIGLFGFIFYILTRSG